MMRCKSSQFSFKFLFQQFLACVRDNASKQSMTAISQCVATITLESEAKDQEAAVKKFVADIQNKKSREHVCLCYNSLLFWIILFVDLDIDAHTSSMVYILQRCGLFWIS